MKDELKKDSPVRALGEVVIDGGEEKRHRAWPSLEVAPGGDLVVAYRAGPDHHVTDEGVSWTGLEPTAMPGQCPALLRLSSGALFCAYRDMTEGEPGMSCAVSHDAGESWEILGHIYRGSNTDCAYPSMVELPEGRIFCAFYTSAEPVPTTGSCEIHGMILEDRSS